MFEGIVSADAFVGNLWNCFALVRTQEIPNSVKELGKVSVV
jgi:hypothetical protein